MNIKQCVNFLTKYKYIVGLDKYEIWVAEEFESLGDGIAEVKPNIFEKTLKFVLDHKFKTKTKEQQQSILIHELVHGRLAILDREKNELTAYVEEQYCNDLERGIFKLLSEK